MTSDAKAEHLSSLLEPFHWWQFFLRRTTSQMALWQVGAQYAGGALDTQCRGAAGDSRSRNNQEHFSQSIPCSWKTSAESREILGRSFSTVKDFLCVVLQRVLVNRTRRSRDRLIRTAWTFGAFMWEESRGMRLSSPGRFVLFLWFSHEVIKKVKETFERPQKHVFF